MTERLLTALQQLAVEHAEECPATTLHADTFLSDPVVCCCGCDSLLWRQREP